MFLTKSQLVSFVSNSAVCTHSKTRVVFNSIQSVSQIFFGNITNFFLSVYANYEFLIFLYF